jgi:lipoate-protein ligase B
MDHDRSSRQLWEIPLGRKPYEWVWDFQKRLLSRRAEGQIPDCLITTEHEPVITMGRGTHKSNLLADADELKRRGVALFEIERGGDITFHGPGQLVLYPIIDLKERGRDSHKYLRDLEQVTILTLAEFGLTAGTKKGLTGVWVGDAKVAAIGVAASKWITYHGVALNVATDLDYFKLINPCGITNYPVGSVANLLGRDPGLEQLRSTMVKQFAEYFGYASAQVHDPDSLLSDHSD